MSQLRLIPLAGLVILCALTAAAADQQAEQDVIAATGAADAGAPGAQTASYATADLAPRSSRPAVQPILHPGLPERVVAALHEAIPIAQRHIEENRECRALFARFGADGLELLGRTFYAPVTTRERTRLCRGGRVALTAVGGSVTKPCPELGYQDPERVAVTLIHEALHFAGQTEYPYDRNAPDSLGITEMVTEACRF